MQQCEVCPLHSDDSLQLLASLVNEQSHGPYAWASYKYSYGTVLEESSTTTRPRVHPPDSFICLQMLHDC